MDALTELVADSLTAQRAPEPNSLLDLARSAPWESFLEPEALPVIEQRGALLPLALYSDGSARFDWDSGIAAPLAAFIRLAQQDADLSQPVSTHIGNALMAGPFPASLGSLANRARSMVRSRAQRSRNTETEHWLNQERKRSVRSEPQIPEGNLSIRAYHGTGVSRQFDKFNPNELPAEQRDMVGDIAKDLVFFSPNPNYASGYAHRLGIVRDHQNGRVFPVDINDAKIFDYANARHREQVIPTILKSGFTRSPSDFALEQAESAKPLSLVESLRNRLLRGDSALHESDEFLRAIRHHGYDGYVRLGDGWDEIAMFPTGKIRSSTTGETLYSTPALPIQNLEPTDN